MSPGLAPKIELLSAGTFNKRLPYRCNVCITKRQPNGKIGDCVNARSIKHFLTQHLQSDMHIKNLRKVAAKCGEEAVECQGLSVSDPQAQSLYDFRAEFALWAGMSNLKAFAKHSYWQNANSDEWFIRSYKCTKKCKPKEGCRPTCSECLQLGHPRGVSRSLICQRNIEKCNDTHTYIYIYVLNSECVQFLAFFWIGFISHLQPALLQLDRLGH